MTIRIARAAIVRHFENGLSLTETAIQFGLEPNRLHALCRSLGIEPPERAYQRKLPDVEDLVAMLRSGATPLSLGRKYRVTQQAVYAALYRVGMTYRAGAVVAKSDQPTNPIMPAIDWPHFGDAA